VNNIELARELLFGLQNNQMQGSQSLSGQQGMCGAPANQELIMALSNYVGQNSQQSCVKNYPLGYQTY